MFSILFTNKAKSRLPWAIALGVWIMIWSLWLSGLQMNPFAAPLHLSENLPSNQLSEVSAELVGPIPISEPTVPKYASFDSFAGHENDSFVTDRPLILYSFFETPLALKNLKFFISHALHDNADFLFVLQGDTDAEMLLPVAGNIRFVKRENDCYDLGAFAEVLTTNDLYKKYTKYITMNSSIRGPFFPYWATGCWSERYLSRVTEDTKLVGLTMNCRPRVHIQSMMWATDRVGMEILLFPSASLVEKYKEILGDRDTAPVPKMKVAGINSCPHDYWDAVAVEVYATGLLQTAGFKVNPIMMAYHTSEKYEEQCGSVPDLLGPGDYYGMDLHPYDTIFHKTNRGLNELVLERLTSWADQSGYSSYDACKAPDTKPNKGVKKGWASRRQIWAR
ncbi:hypothetical protein B2J93_5469 [Marssonina coronariae]|uniref:Uncharacterized protein n=1 Tax=Diplocarpon coronariae TaxID=2795749 RepID=A0A218YZJ4_9HELO|nr:hypothetical protein B2J93_5469 [Marssonina coronariae]